jgi:hypothetical protein
MAIAGIAIEAAVFAARVGVHGVGNREVGAFYAVDDRGGENLNVGGLGFIGGEVGIPLVCIGIEAILGVVLGTASGLHPIKVSW